MTDARPRITVVLGTRNRLDMLRNCLESLRKGFETPHEIVVVDAGSTDGTVEYLRSLDSVRAVFDGRPIGQAQSLNRVFREIETEYVCWISDDNVVQPGAMDTAVRVLDAEPQIGMVALKVRDMLGTYAHEDYIGGLAESGILTCNQGVLRTDVFRSVGFFDEAFKNYGIDTDLTASILRAGYSVVFTKDVAIRHYRDHGAAPGAIDQSEREERRKAMVRLYAEKHQPLLRRTFRDRFAWLFGRLLWFALRAWFAITRAGTVLGYSRLDWYNVLHARYISFLDPLWCRGAAYHLEQHIGPRGDTGPTGAKRTLIRNSAANAAGQLLPPVLSLVLVPFYLKTLGLTGYGVAAFISALVGLLAVFSSGIGWALQREIARHQGDADPRPRNDLIRTFEIAYWMLGAVIGALLLFIGWVTLRRGWDPALGREILAWSLALVAIRVALAFPLGVYACVFNGLQRQVELNRLTAASALATALLNVVFLSLWPTLVVYYATELVVAVVYAFFARRAAWRLVPGSATTRGHFDFARLKDLTGFSLALVWVHAVAVIVKQVDRVIIGRFLPLASLGIYSVASAPGRVLSMAYSPFLTAVYPQTCAIAHRGEAAELRAHILRNARVVTIIVAAIGIPAAAFSHDLLLLWTRNAAIADGGAQAMRLYLYGSMMLAMTNVFYQAHTAAGEALYGVRFNTAAVIWYPLAMFLLVGRFGLEGAAFVWCAYGALAWGYFTLTSVRFIDQSGLLAYGRDTVTATICAILCAMAARFIADGLHMKFLTLIIIVLTIGANLAMLYWIVLRARSRDGSAAPSMTPII